MRRARVLAGRTAGVLLAGLAAASCASLPPTTPPRVAKTPAAYQAGHAFDAAAAEWPADNWWRRYGDPQLNALIDEALRGSPSLAQAASRLVQARSAVGASTAALLPALTAQGSVNEAKQSGRYLFPPAFLPRGYQDYGQLSLNLTWELDFWGRNRAAVAAAVSEARAAAADQAEARLVLTTDLAGAYAELARLYADRDVAVQSAQLRQETAQLVAQRVANGVDTQAELKQAAAAPPAQRAQIAALDESIAQTRNQIAALIGEGPGRGEAIQRPPAASLAAFGLPADLRLNLLGRRPDVVAARWRAEAAERRVGQAKAAFYPDVSLTGYLGQQSIHLSQLLASGAGIGAIGPAVSLPVFQGGRLRAQLRGARAEHDTAVAAYDQALSQALRQVADVAASERALAERLAQSREALADYEGAYKVARLRFEGGLATFQSVLLAEDAVLAERQAVSDLQSRAFTLDVALVRALGGGFGALQTASTESPHA